MATVYLAIQENLDREVALKIMSPALSEDKNFSERFLREARIVSRLVHPHIVTVHDIGIQNGHHYLAMEYIHGKDLKQQLPGLSAEQIFRVLRQVASALDYSGRKGYIHRDVKPENIMLHVEDGRAVLMDFGIARAADCDSTMTRTGTALGTPHYMSPEQARGDAIDGRSDLYSLGVLLYYMLTGNVPYEADSAVAVGIKHLTAPVPSLPAALAGYQPLINKLMAKKPEDRYQCGYELIAAMDQFDPAILEQWRQQQVIEYQSEHENTPLHSPRGSSLETGADADADGLSRVSLKTGSGANGLSRAALETGSGADGVSRAALETGSGVDGVSQASLEPDSVLLDEAAGKTLKIPVLQQPTQERQPASGSTSERQLEPAQPYQSRQPSGSREPPAEEAITIPKEDLKERRRQSAATSSVASVIIVMLIGAGVAGYYFKDSIMASKIYQQLAASVGLRLMDKPLPSSEKTPEPVTARNKPVAPVDNKPGLVDGSAKLAGKHSTANGHATTHAKPTAHNSSAVDENLTANNGSVADEHLTANHSSTADRRSTANESPSVDKSRAAKINTPGNGASQTLPTADTSGQIAVASEELAENPRATNAVGTREQRQTAPDNTTLEQLLQRSQILAAQVKEQPGKTTGLVTLYRQILAMQPDQTQATTALAEIKTATLAAARSQIDAGHLQAGKQHLTNALTWFPGLENEDNYRRLEDRLNTAQQISTLLSQAEHALNRDRLIRPANDNARDAFTGVLALDPENETAKKGLARIVARYHTLAVAAQKKRDYKKVLTLVSSGLSINASYRPLLDLRTQVRADSEREQKISALLIQAEIMESQQQLFGGKQSAVAYYQSVLNIDPQQIDARQSLEHIVKALFSRVESLMADNDYDQAITLVEDALKSLPGDASLQAMLRELNEKKPAIDNLILSGQPIVGDGARVQGNITADRTLHIAFHYQGLVENATVLQALLFDGGRSVQMAAVPVVVMGDNGATAFRIDRPVEGFADGGYHLDILLAGKRIFTRSFVITR